MSGDESDESKDKRKMLIRKVKRRVGKDINRFSMV